MRVTYEFSLSSCTSCTWTFPTTFLSLVDSSSGPWPLALTVDTVFVNVTAHGFPEQADIPEDVVKQDFGMLSFEFAGIAPGGASEVLPDSLYPDFSCPVSSLFCVLDSFGDLRGCVVFTDFLRDGRDQEEAPLSIFRLGAEVFFSRSLSFLSRACPTVSAVSCAHERSAENIEVAVTTWVGQTSRMEECLPRENRSSVVWKLGRSNRLTCRSKTDESAGRV